MPVTTKEFTIGLMITALLEDKFNKTGHMREECLRVVGVYENKLKPLGRVVSTGFFEYEPEAAKALARLRNSKVGIIGHPYEGMTDLMQDDYALMDTFGTSLMVKNHCPSPASR